MLLATQPTDHHGRRRRTTEMLLCGRCTQLTRPMPLPLQDHGVVGSVATTDQPAAVAGRTTGAVGIDNRPTRSPLLP